MEKTRPNIRQVEVAEIERFIAQVGEKPFRVKQIVEWLWQKHAHSFDEMTNLSKDLRKQLVEINPGMFNSDINLSFQRYYSSESACREAHVRRIRHLRPT